LRWLLAHGNEKHRQIETVGEITSSSSSLNFSSEELSNLAGHLEVLVGKFIV